MIDFLLEIVMSGQRVPFLQQLRESSKGLHAISNVLVVAKLMVAFTQPEVYALALGCFWHVYRSLEEELCRNKKQPELQGLVELLPQMERAPRFEQDLKYFLGSEWRDSVKPSREVRAYLMRLEEVSRTKPYLLVAHSFNMHAAMAAGGQATRRMARKHMKLENGHGTAAFEFEGNLAELRKRLHAAVNAVPEQLTREQCQEILAEHNILFQHNIKIIKGFQVGWHRCFVAMRKLTPSYVAWGLPLLCLLVLTLLCKLVLYIKS